MKAIKDGDQDVVDATQLQLVYQLPEFGAFGLLDPKTKNGLVAAWIEPMRDVGVPSSCRIFWPGVDPVPRRG